jgi:hypothetical protein
MEGASRGADCGGSPCVMEAVTYGRKKVSVAVKWDKQTGLASLQSKTLDENMSPATSGVHGTGRIKMSRPWS